VVPGDTNDQGAQNGQRANDASWSPAISADRRKAAVIGVEFLTTAATPSLLPKEAFSSRSGRLISPTEPVLSTGGFVRRTMT
jgi:hypothetical protein